MATDPDWAALETAWAPARKSGVLGSATIEELRAHAAGYIPAACGVFDELRGIDLGSGAGVPGLLLALAMPASSWTLVDASERRCEAARRAVRAMAIGDRVDVAHIRAEDLADDPGAREQFDLVVSRLFGPASMFAEVAMPLTRLGGIIAVSATDATVQQWRAALAGLPLEEVEQRTTTAGRFLHLRRSGDVPPEWPRRPNAQRRDPLL